MARLLTLLCVLGLSQAIADENRGVPAGLLQLPSDVGTVLVADVATATLRRFALRDGRLVERDTHYMSIGRNGAGKQRAWDRKTPLGIYFITDELDTRRLHDRYGDRAFALDYPNAWDRYRERTGDGIWIHGVDRRDPERPPRDTDGCIALPNPQIKALAEEFLPLTTPVIVTRQMDWTPATVAATQRQHLASALAAWERSVEENDLAAYLALYADDFSARGMTREEWAEWRRRVFARRGALALDLYDITLIADPEETGLFLSRFTQRLRSGEASVSTMKRLYWRYGAAGGLQIVTEDNG